ncbi:acyl carrier protein [Sulfurifustis variabilis]|uniref:Acyl carrier protein n=1 Tax=Sulfurifustis variabilis TaxID=1675686 RepID=A0A1B4V3G3_9GAMM|nr:acyl carrier protein [Sulfurifustis variabilis]BAU47905.1 acyl carrier protein [Sulfurifustis variabilis]
MSDIKQQLRAYLLDNFLMGGSADEIRDDTSFMASHILDSTGFLELIAHLEETYGVKVKDEEMIPENLDSLSSIERFLARKQSA